MSTVAVRDLKKLRELADEVDGLVEAGHWSEEHYRRILAEARQAAGGSGDALGFVQMEARPEWRDRDEAATREAQAAGAQELRR